MNAPLHPEAALADAQAAGEWDASAEALHSAVIMMVDDEPLITEVTQTYLEEAGYRHFIACHDAREALNLMRRHRPSMMLLDIMMPGVSGFEILEQARADRELRYIPIVVLTSASSPDTKLRALERGATEFLSKPVDPSELILRVRNTLAFKLYQDRLASVDPVTGLANRETFTRDLHDAMLRCAAQGKQLGLLHLDLTRFRELRGTLGPGAADDLLKLVADRLEAALREHLGAATKLMRGADGQLARMGSQDFAVKLEPLADAEDAAMLATHLLDDLNRAVNVHGHEVYLAPAAGISLFPSDGVHPEALLRNADLACAKAQASAGDGYAFFSEELTVRSLERLTLAGQLRRALANGELVLHYQPKLNVASGRVIGAEALVRWQHPELGLLPPGRFIPLAEESDLIVDVGSWVLEQACRDAARWPRDGLAGLKVAVNVARAQFMSGRFFDLLRRCLRDSGLPPTQLVIEITESALMEDTEAALALMKAVSHLGVALSIDDFGTGYSSLSYLKRLPVAELKVDRSFIVDLPTSSQDTAIVHTIISLGQSLGMSVVAEGVERDTQLDILRDKGCDEFQGFLFARALPYDDFVQRVRQHQGEGSA